MDPRLIVLLEGLDRAYDKSAWHGTTLKGCLRGMKAETALWRPAPERHCIWEYVLHAAYWKYRVRRWVAPEGARAFERSPSDWPQVGSNEGEWVRDRRFLQQEHVALRAAFVRFDASKLDEATTARGPTYQTLMLGAAAHDVHHAGQIQLLRRLAPPAAR